MDDNNNLTGRGIGIDSFGTIRIGYFANNGKYAPGNYIVIWSDGDFHVGEYYRGADGALDDRYTYYRPDGTTSKHGYEEEEADKDGQPEEKAEEKSEEVGQPNPTRGRPLKLYQPSDFDTLKKMSKATLILKAEKGVF